MTKPMPKTKLNYGTYHRQQTRRKTDACRALVVKTFSEAWENGYTFSIVMDDEGIIRVKSGTKTVGYYEDAMHFAADFMPELLK